jgi:glycosyltransferase involved in cell wall biosynthesis
MELPRITVVIPSFNQARFIGKTLDSVLDQNYPGLELIVVDGGSTDGSVEIIRERSAQIAWWVSEKDAGQTDALIKGFRRSTGEIQCWLNSDDLFEPTTLREVGDWFRHHPRAEAVFGDALWIDERETVLRAQREIPFNRFLWMYTHNYIPGMSMFWRKSLYERVGGLSADFNLAMDADLWIRFADAGAQLTHVRKTWSRMRFYPQQKNRRLRTQSDAEDLRIRARYWGPSPPRLLSARRAFAQGVRVLWKAATGCYSWNYKRYLDGR